MRLFFVVSMIMAFVHPAFSQTPDWVKEYRAKAGRVCFQAKQSSLEVLHNSSRGNCVAFAKLGAEIAMKNGLVCESISIGSPGEDRHRIALVHDYDGRLWVISNDDIHRVVSMQAAIDDSIAYLDTSWAFRPMPWEASYHSYRGDDSDVDYDDWGFRSKHTFTEEELR